MQGQFEGKAVLVTGAGSGMGLATATAFAAAGARVALADRDAQAVHEATARLCGEGAIAIAVQCDVAIREQVAAMVEQVVATFGCLDVAFNNAGVNRRRTIALADLDDDEWDRIMSVNLRGTWFCMQHELRQMLTQCDGVIVNCASSAGLRGLPGAAAYVASKHAVVGLTRTAALEYAAKGIRVNAVCPGPIDTPMMHQVTGGAADVLAGVGKTTPVGRLGRPEEVASAVLWLAGLGAGYVTGQAISIDGGASAR